ncbi:MAG: hypothetical protein KI793_33950 [Rivularia sp. (in: Bacteria)]|nr:hypothetical protein [Rivularia sp. MS3]
MPEYLNMPGGRKKVVDGFNFLGLGNFTSLINVGLRHDIKYSSYFHNL